MPNRLEESTNTKSDKSNLAACLAEKEARCALVDEGFGRPQAIVPGKMSEAFGQAGSEIKAGGPYKLPNPFVHDSEIKAGGPYKTKEPLIKGSDNEDIKALGPYETKEPLIKGGGGRCERTDKSATSENPDIIFNPDGSYKEPKADDGTIKVTPGGRYELPKLIFPKQQDKDAKENLKNRAASQLPFELPTFEVKKDRSRPESGPFSQPAGDLVKPNRKTATQR